MTTDRPTSRATDARTLDSVPSDGALDATVSLLREGYGFIGRRCDRLGSDVFRTRLMMRTAICFRGPDWAELFYGAEGLTRVGAMPTPVLRLLQDKGSVQQLEGAAHRHRKALFTNLLLDETRVTALVEQFRDVWHGRLLEWEARGDVCLLTEVSDALAEAVCRWAGVSLEPPELDAMAGAMFRMVDQAGRPRVATLAAIGERRRTERRLRRIVAEARDGTCEVDTPLARIACFRDGDGELLPIDVAAVELLNVLRPTVAVGRYITFAALALHQGPEWRDQFQAGNDNLLEPFCEEVRRLAPFFPMTAAVTREAMTWGGLSLPEGQWLIFDLYGTLHDARYFPEPETLRPERLLSWREEEDRFVPQGGGDVHKSHRCPGEMATVALIAEATRILCRDMDYRVPDQDLSVRMNRVPAQPASGFVIADVNRRVPDAGAPGAR